MNHVRRVSNQGNQSAPCSGLPFWPFVVEVDESLTLYRMQFEAFMDEAEALRQ